MSELRKQICDYYGSQSLPPGKVAAIIAKGRAVAGDDSQAQLAPEPPVSRFVHRRSLLALAASVTVLAMAWQFSRNSSAVDFGQTRRGLASFFAVSPSFPLLSAQPEELRQWALAHGAPAFQIPAKLSNLSGEACTTLDIEGKPAFLLCFKTVDASGQQDGGLVHLIVARRADYRNTPESSVPATFTEGRWSFASWAENEIVYTIASTEGPEKVRQFLTAGNVPKTDGVPFLLAAVWKANGG
jgi:hypothetical protein